jgi:hypothetical protein
MKVIASNKKRTEIEQFAMWFHQDWGLLFSSFDEAAEKYLAQLPASRREVLRKELSAFLEAHAGATRQGMMRWWMKLGAQGGERNLKDALRKFVSRLESPT